MDTITRPNHIQILLGIVCSTLVLSVITARADLPVGGNLQFWLKADAGVQTSGSSVTNWLDQSGQGNNAFQTSGALQPTVPGSTLNGLPLVRFDGVNDTLRVLDANGLDGGPGMTIFAVTYNEYENTADKTFLSKWLHGSNSSWLLDEISAEDALQMFVAGTPADTGANWTRTSAQLALLSNRFNVVNALYDGTQAASVDRIKFFVNGFEPVRFVAAGTIPTTLLNAANDMFVGSDPGLGRFFDSDMAEVILYNRALNSAERNVIDNHLAAKWDVPMTTGNPYVGDDAGKGNYDSGVFGVGRVDVGNQLLSSSTSNGLAITANSLADNQWMLAGHKEGTSGLTTDDVEGGSRLERVWYLDKTGTPTDNFTLTFDFSDMGLAFPGSGGLYSLLYLGTNSFETSSTNFTVISQSFSIVGDEVSFTLAGGSLIDGYYTLAVVPEPGTVLLFAVGGLVLWRRRTRRRLV